jgi:hypothetical protein
MAKIVRSQSYPRINDEGDKYNGYLDDSQLVDHHFKIDNERLKQVITDAITYANKKSSREILSVPTNYTVQEQDALYHKTGNELFKYFVKYCGDPASTAYDCIGKHYEQIARENFRNRTIQMERMNAGWRYQHIA